MTEGRGTNYAVIAALILASGLATWAVLALRGRAVDSGATAAARPSGPVTPREAPRTPPSPDMGSAVEAARAREAAAAAAAPELDTTGQDQRQSDKITSGLAVNPAGGILVLAVPPQSVVSQLRVEAGDVIVSVNGQPVASPEEFAGIYREHGLPRQMTVLRQGREIHRH
jgi:S1-C subfamily serine protease